jgi:hypothetical protein
MNLEELRQQQARGIRQMRTRAALDLRQIRLADAVALAQFLANGPNQFQLRHGALEPAKRSFDFAEVTDFFAQLHINISNRDIYIAICDLCQDLYYLCIQGVTAGSQLLLGGGL